MKVYRSNRDRIIDKYDLSTENAIIDFFQLIGKHFKERREEPDRQQFSELLQRLDSVTDADIAELEFKEEEIDVTKYQAYIDLSRSDILFAMDETNQSLKNIKDLLEDKEIDTKLTTYVEGINKLFQEALDLAKAHYNNGFGSQLFSNTKEYKDLLQKVDKLTATNPALELVNNLQKVYTYNYNITTNKLLKTENNFSFNNTKKIRAIDKAIATTVIKTISQITDVFRLSQDYYNNISTRYDGVEDITTNPTDSLKGVVPENDDATRELFDRLSSKLSIEDLSSHTFKHICNWCTNLFYSYSEILARSIQSYH